jgi:hypothetical protein
MAEAGLMAVSISLVGHPHVSRDHLTSGAYVISWLAMEIAHPLLFMKPEPDGIVNQFFGEF